MGRIALKSCTVLFLSLLQGALLARDMSGKFGVGYQQSLGGVSGISARYWIGDFALIGTVGLDLVKLGSGETPAGLALAVGGVYAFSLSENANLCVGLMADFGYRNKSANRRVVYLGDECKYSCPNGQSNLTSECTLNCTPKQEIQENSVFQVNVEVPLVVEYFFTDSFSFHLATGIVVTIVPEKGRALDSEIVRNGATGVGASGGSGGREVGVHIGSGGVLGTAGFTYYF
jgi:hypothetical protein